MRKTLGISVTLLAFACGAAAAPMTREEYKAAKKRIVAEYESDRQKCGPLYGNALDLCVARARGVRDVANSELQAVYKPGPRTYYDAAIARSKADYSNAKERCDEERGVAKKACLKDAKKALDASRSEAKAAMARTRAEDAAKPPR